MKNIANINIDISLITNNIKNWNKQADQNRIFTKFLPRYLRGTFAKSNANIAAFKAAAPHNSNIKSARNRLGNVKYTRKAAINKGSTSERLETKSLRFTRNIKTRLIWVEIQAKKPTVSKQQKRTTGKKEASQARVETRTREDSSGGLSCASPCDLSSKRTIPPPPHRDE